MIIRTPAIHNVTRFNTPITKQFLKSHFFRLHVDGGANCSVTNYCDYLDTSWDITPYKIVGIGDGITCTAKVIFHLIFTDGSVLTITMFYSKEATETTVSPTDTVFSNADSFSGWWKIDNCATGNGELRSYKINGITRCSAPLVMQNKL